MQKQGSQTSTIPARVPPCRRLATVAQAAEVYPAFSQSSFRDLIFKADDRFNSRGDLIKGNGLGEAGVIIRVNRKVVLDLDRFDAWLDSQAKIEVSR